MQLPETGFLRINQIVGDPKADPPIPALIPIGRSTWWGWVKIGKAPSPVKLSPRVTCWKTADILALLDKLGMEGGS